TARMQLGELGQVVHDLFDDQPIACLFVVALCDLRRGNPARLVGDWFGIRMQLEDQAIFTREPPQQVCAAPVSRAAALLDAALKRLDEAVEHGGRKAAPAAHVNAGSLTAFRLLLDQPKELARDVERLQQILNSAHFPRDRDEAKLFIEHQVSAFAGEGHAQTQKARLGGCFELRTEQELLWGTQRQEEPAQARGAGFGAFLDERTIGSDAGAGSKQNDWAC